MLCSGPSGLKAWQPCRHGFSVPRPPLFCFRREHIKDNLRLPPTRKQIIDIILCFEELGYDFDEIMEMLVGTAIETWGVNKFCIDEFRSYVQSVFNSYFSQ